MKFFLIQIFLILISNKIYSEKFFHYSKQQGIGSNRIHDFIELDIGIYFFTAKGIWLWNGNKFTEVLNNKKPIDSEIIIAEKGSGNKIWFSTIRGEIGYIINKRAYFIKYNLTGKRFISENWISQIYIDPLGLPYFIIYPNKVIYINSKNEVKPIESKLYYIYPNLINKNKYLIGISSNFPFKLKDNKISRYISKNFKSEKYTNIKLFSDNFILYETLNESFISDINLSFKVNIKAKSRKNSNVFRIEKSLYFCEDKKVYKYDLFKNQFIASDSFNFNDISRIKKLNDGTLIFSTLSNGFYVKKKSINGEYFPFGNNEPVFSVSKLEDDNLYFGGFYGNISVLKAKENVFRRLPFGNSVFKFGLGRVFSFHNFQKAIIVCSEQRGIILSRNYKKASYLSYGLRCFSNFTDKAIFSSSRELHLGRDIDLINSIVGSYPGFEKNMIQKPIAFSSIQKTKGIRPNSFITSDSSIIISSNKGLWEMNEKYVKLIKLRNLGYIGNSSGIVRVGKNRYGFVSNDFNFYIVDELKKSSIGQFSIPKITVNKLVQKSGNSFWICTDDGLYLATFSKNFAQNKLIKFTTKDGLLSNEIYDLTFARGKWWVCTSLGLSILAADFYQPRKEAPPHPSYFAFSINGQDTSRLASRLITGRTDVRFSFGCLSLQHLGNLQFRYRLSPGLNWIYTDKFDHELNSLSYGDYRIEVQAKSPNSVWSASLFFPNFEILPPVWERGWFIVLGTALFFSMVIALLYNFQRISIARLQLESEMTDASLRSLRAQMKPHFLSNILNSMHYFILSERPEESGNFVQGFSRLVRHILDASDKNYSQLSGEIRQLKDYLHFECRRADRLVQMEIHYQYDSDFSKTLIPTMLLQPLVENALMHGILPLKYREGLITIRIGKVESARFREIAGEGICISDAGRLLIQVCDNGQGRLASAPLNQHRPSPSYGLRAIRDRLAWMQRKFGIHAEMIVTDRFDAAGNAAGTCITLNLPLLERLEKRAFHPGRSGKPPALSG